MKFYFSLLCIVCSISLFAQDNSGCTNPLALNFDAEAIVDDESCLNVNHTPEEFWGFQTSEFSHLIVIPENADLSINGEPLKLGDFIGVFYTYNDQEYCAGYSYWTGTNTHITVWGSNVESEFQIGTAFEFKVWDSEKAIAYSAEASYTVFGPYIEGLFSVNAFSQINTLSASGTTDVAINSISNPTNGCGITSTDFTVELSNLGTTDVYFLNLDLTYNSILITDAQYLNLASESTILHSFENTIDVSEFNTIEFSVSIDDSFDDNATNNLTSSIVDNQSPLNVLVNVTQASCIGFSDASISVEVLGDDGTYTIDWEGEFEGFEISSLTAGMYEFTVSNDDLCSTTIQTEIAETEALSFESVYEPILCTDSTTEVSLNISGGVGDYVIDWQGNNNLALMAGAYTAIISDANLCSFLAEFTLLEPEPIIIENSIISVPCIGQTASVELQIYGGTGNYTIDWQGIDSLEMFEGDYTVLVSDDNSCLIEHTISIVDPDEISINLNIIDALCVDGFGMIDPIVNGGVAPYVISFDNDMLALEPGNYLIAIEDANECVKNEIFSIEESESGLFDCFGITFLEDSLLFEQTNSFSVIELEIPIYSAISQVISFNSDNEYLTILEDSLIFNAEGSQSIHVEILAEQAIEFFADITASANVWGEASLTISGSIVQPELQISANNLDFQDNTLLNADTLSFWIYNNGNANLDLSTISSSSSIVTLDWYNNTIMPGDSLLVNAIYEPINSGYLESLISIESNDPINSISQISCVGNAVSEVYGVQTGVWSAINSPYSIVGDVIVPDGDSLLIEAGVVVVFKNDYYISVFGTFEAIGAISDSITFRSVDSIPHGAFIFNETDNPIVFDYCKMDGLNQNNGFPVLLSGTVDYANYTEDFSSGANNGWYSSAYSSGVTGGAYYNDYYYNSSWNTSYSYSPQVVITEGLPVEFDFRYRNDWDYYSNGTLRFQYQTFNGDTWSGWNEFTYDDYEQTSWTTRSFNIANTNDVYAVQFRFYNYFYRSMYFDLDYFNITQSTPYNVLNGVVFREENLEASVFDIHVSELELKNSSIVNCAKRLDFNGNEGVFNLDSTSAVISNTHFANNSSYAFKTAKTSLNIVDSYFEDKGISMSVNTDSLTLDYVVFESCTNDAIYINGDSLNLNINNSSFEGQYVNSITIAGQNAQIDIRNSSISNGNANGLEISATNSNLTFSNLIFEGNNSYAYYATNYGVNLIADSLLISGNANGFKTTSSNSTLNIFDSQFVGNLGTAIETNGQYSHVDLEKVILKENGSNAIYMTGDAFSILNNCVIRDNGGIGLRTGGHQIINYSTIFNNSGRGLHSDNSIELKNSIVYGNNANALMQIYCSYNLDAQYSAIQGVYSYGINSNPNEETLNQVITADPLLSPNGYLLEGSPAIDAAMPWEHDHIMPPGLLGVTADMGAYGGPNNQVWGDGTSAATEIPDGAPSILEIIDIPQDQGGFVGLQFQGSVFDYGLAGYDISYYSIWRNLQLDPTGEDFWEKIGEIPSQSFQYYGFTAETLGDSIMDSPVVSRFSIIAHTNFDDVYWMSEVASGYSVDNVAPLMPDGMEGRYAYEGGLTIDWNSPTEADYILTEIYRNGELVATTTETEFLDETALANETYSYFLHHLDLSGNSSEAGVIEVSSLLPNWELAISEKTHHIAIPENFTISTSNDVVERGDFLGVFYMNNGALTCGGMAQWSDEDVVLTAFGTSEELLGFANNEEFVWRFWDVSKNEYYNANVTYDSNLPNSANFIEDGLSALQSIDIYAKHSINLPQGWSMISSYVQEDNTLLSALFAPVNEDIFIVKDENGTVYWPAYNFNDIGDLSELHGYKLLMAEENDIDFVGRKVIPNETVLNLEEGWQIMPYLREQAASAEVLFDPVVESVIIVKDDLGNVYWPEWGINTIGNLKPGKGYQVKLTNDRNFNYPANALELPLEQRLGNFNPSYFVVQNCTASNMTLGIPLDAWDVKPNVLDEIAVCDAQDRVLGSAVFAGSDLVISIWEDDEYSATKQGFVTGESFQLKYRDQVNNATYSLKVIAWEQGSAQFETDEIAIVSWIEHGSLIDQDFHIYPVVPNPSTATAQLQFFSPEAKLVSLKMFNILGELVLEELLNVEEGMSVYEIPSHRFNNGTYTVKVETTSGVEVQSIQIIR